MTDNTWHHAWQWLCHRRQKAPPGADIWHLRFHRERELPRLIREAESGTYRLSPMQVIRRKAGQESLVQWSARDALVLKWVSLQLNGKLPLSPRCTHTAGHRGGTKRTAGNYHPPQGGIPFCVPHRYPGLLPSYQ